MKRSVIIFFLCLFSLSCNDDLQDNTPSIQGIQNGEILWRALGYNVATQGGITTITANTNTSTLQLIIPSLNTGVYELNSSSAARVTFEEESVFYSTAFDGTGSPAVTSDGEIVIESLGGEPNSITGTFRFNAYDESGQLTVNFIEGIIFKIPR